MATLLSSRSSFEAAPTLTSKTKTTKQLLNFFHESGGVLSQEEKTRLKDLPRLIKQEQAKARAQ